MRLLSGTYEVLISAATQGKEGRVALHSTMLSPIRHLIMMFASMPGALLAYAEVVESLQVHILIHLFMLMLCTVLPSPVD